MSDSEAALAALAIAAEICVAVLRQQHLRELAEPLGLLVAAAGIAGRIGRGVGSGRILLVGLAVLGRRLRGSG